MGREARANQTAIDVIAPFFLNVPFAKVDAEKRLVSGVATAENLDKQGDIVDYATAKAFFTDPEKWPGNIREMHKAEAVGTAVDVACDDTAKAISITAHVSEGAPNTWAKVLDGTLKMFSIGGSGKRVAEKMADGTKGFRLFLEQLAEVSLVDNGANPLAKFEIVKSVDGKLVAAEVDTPIAPEPVAKAETALDAAIAETVPPAYVAGTIRTLVAGLAKVSDWRVQKDAAIAQAAAAGTVAIGELPVPWRPKPLTADDIKDLKVLNRDGTPATHKAAEAVAKGSPEPYDIDSALTAISFVNRLMANEYWEARYSSSDGGASDSQKQQIAMLKAACDALLNFLQAEYAEQFVTDDTTSLDLSDVIDTDDTVEMFVKSLAIVQKAGARHSKGDVDMIQKAHDLTSQLGANCHTDDAEKVAQAVVEKLGQIEGTVAELVVEKTAEPTDVQKLTAALETATAELATLKATAAEKAKADAEVTKRLETLEAQPMPGGPARSAHAVDKSLGGPNDTAAVSTETDEVLKAYDLLARVAKTEDERFELANKRLAVMHAQNVGRTDIVSGRPLA